MPDSMRPRDLRRMTATRILSVVASAAALPSIAVEEQSGSGSGWVFRWGPAPPSDTPSNLLPDGPLLGNGNLGAAVGFDNVSGGLALHLGSNALWSTNLRTPLADTSLDHRFWVTSSRLPACTLVVRPESDSGRTGGGPADGGGASAGGQGSTVGGVRNFTGCFEAALDVRTATLRASVGPAVPDATSASGKGVGAGMGRRLVPQRRTAAPCPLTMTVAVPASLPLESQHAGQDAANGAATDAVVATVTSARTGAVTVELRTSRGWPLFLPSVLGSDAIAGELWLGKAAVNVTANALTVTPCGASVFPSVQAFAVAPGNNRTIAVDDSRWLRPDLRCLGASQALVRRNCSDTTSSPALTVTPCELPRTWRLREVAPKGGAGEATHELVSADGLMCAAVPRLPTSSTEPGTFPAVNTPGYVVAVPCRGAATAARWAVRGSRLQLVVDSDDARSERASQAGAPSWQEERQPLCLTATTPNNRVTAGVAVRVRHPNGTSVALRGAAQSRAGPWATVSASFLATEGVEYALTAALTTTTSWRQPGELDSDSNLTAVMTDAASAARAGAAAAASQRSVLMERHTAWWAAFWQRSSVELNAWPLLTSLWRRLLYVMASAASPASPAPGLYGPWVTSDTPSWAGEYTLDYNYESPLWGVFAASHPELAESYFAPLVAAVPLGRARAAGRNWTGGALGFPGWQVNGYNNAGGSRPPLGGFGGVELPAIVGPTLCRGLCNYWWDTGQRSIAAFAALNFVSYYDHTQDRAWLATVGYPYVKEVAEFYRTWLVWDPVHGWYRIVDSSGGERDTPTSNNTQTDASYCRAVLGAAVRWSAALGVDPTLRREWAGVLDRLEPFATAVDNVTGLTVFVFSDPPVGRERGGSGAGATAGPVGSAAGSLTEPSLAVTPVFPSGVIGLDSDAHVLAVARDTAELMVDRAGGLPGRACLDWAAVIRLWRPSNATWLLRAMVAAAGDQPSFVPVDVGGGIEQAGIVEAVNSMLLQSHQRLGLHVFPVWSAAAGPASFANLSAVGGFRVSASVGDGGRVDSPIRVASTAGRNCTVVSPWPGRGVDVTDEITGATVPAATSPDGSRVSFATAAGRAYAVSAEPEGGAAV